VLDTNAKETLLAHAIEPQPSSPPTDQSDGTISVPQSVPPTCVDRRVEIAKIWKIFRVAPDVVLELRALWPNGLEGGKPPRIEHFRATNYSSIEAPQRAFETRALQLNDLGYNVYTVMNPIKPGFAGGAVKDDDILCRRLLLVDIDRAGQKKVPASQSELDAALEVAKLIRSYATSLDFPEPTMVMSGNGYHLYYPLPDLENDAETTEVVQQALLDLAHSFNTGSISVDTTVYNASRITKVPGTLMRKGVDSDERPYRIAVVCDEE
jgi:hypothetical protein